VGRGGFTFKKEEGFCKKTFTNRVLGAEQHEKERVVSIQDERGEVLEVLARKKRGLKKSRSL